MVAWDVLTLDPPAAETVDRQGTGGCPSGLAGPWVYGFVAAAEKGLRTFEDQVVPALDDLSRSWTCRAGDFSSPHVQEAVCAPPVPSKK
jgi:hypothetical protein